MPGDFSAGLALADELLTEGRYDECIALVERLSAEDDSAATKMLLGRCYKGKGDMTQAKNWFAKACGQFPENADLHFERAELLMAAEEFNAADEALTTALRCDRNHRGALFNRGRVRMKLLKFNGAIKDFERAVRGDQKDAMSWMLLGICQLGADHPNNAEECFARALELEPALSEHIDPARQAYRQQKS
jgi:tetratricopeptide (TPR) repeat protein